MTNTTSDLIIVNQILSRYEGGESGYHTRPLKGSLDMERLEGKEAKARLMIEQQKAKIQQIIDGIQYLLQEKERQKKEIKKKVFVSLLAKGTIHQNSKIEFLRLLSNEELIVLYYGVDLKLKTEKKKNKQRCTDDLDIMRVEVLSRGMNVDDLATQYYSLSKIARDSALKLFGVLL